MNIVQISKSESLAVLVKDGVVTIWARASHDNGTPAAAYEGRANFYTSRLSGFNFDAADESALAESVLEAQAKFAGDEFQRVYVTQKIEDWATALQEQQAE